MSEVQTAFDASILDFLLAISRVVVQSADLKPSLDEITHLIRPVLKFDYLLIHQAQENQQDQIIYAKSNQFDDRFVEQLEWEDVLADLVYTSQKTILQQPNLDEENIIDTPHFLGIPLTFTKNHIGTVVFIRNGSPSFSQKDINIAEFIAQQISTILFQNMLQQDLTVLENQRRQSIIQEDFISNITHELRNPLGFIKGYSTTLLRSDIEWDESVQAQFLQIIDQEADRLSELIDNLLDSARLQTGQLDIQLQLLRLDALIKDVVERAQMQNDHIRIILDMKIPLNPILGDARRLTQVIENLIGNAIKHAPNSDIWIKTYQNDQGITISIKDKGPGIPKQYHEKIFDRFFRVPDQSPNVHGSGLGLYISKQIIQSHRGKISVKSNVGEGAEFIIFLPFNR